MTTISTPPVTDVTVLRDVVGVLEPADSQAGAIDRIRQLEELKAACAAAQARETASLAAMRAQDEAARGVAKVRRGKGLDAEVGLARRDSPARGARHVQLAQALSTDLPKTYAALSAGQVSEEQAQIVASETSWLTSAHRQKVDRLIAATLGTVGPRRLAATVRFHAQHLDQHGAVARLAKATSQRRVSVRPAPDNMAYLTALVPMSQAVACFAALRRDATTMVGTGQTTDPTDPTGQPRIRDQIMADLFVQRVTGQHSAAAVPAEVQVVMTAESLFGDGQTPAWLTGHGPIPTATAKTWLTNPEAQIFLRRVFTRPTDHQLVGLESASRAFPAGLRRMIILRDDTCRTPYCDATIQHLDHLNPVRDGGTTSWDNASGLCAGCNQTKENTGWHHTGDPEQLNVTTPTGHCYTTNTTPVLPEIPSETRPPPPTSSTDCYTTPTPVITIAA